MTSCQFITAHWGILTSSIPIIVTFIMGLIMKSKSKEVSIRFLSWLIEKSKDRVLDLTIGLNDVSAVYPKTRIEKIIDYLSLTSDYFKSRVIKKLVDARRLEDEGKGRYRFSKFNNQDLLNQENKK